MHSGTSTVSCAIRIIALSSSASSTSGMPALISRTSAPAATCAAASAATRESSPSRSSWANSLRPVGLMRSPMIANGWPEPMVTALDRERRTVSMLLSFCPGRDPQPLAQLCDAGVLAERDQVDARDARQRQRVTGLLAGELEALLELVPGGVDPGQHLGRHLDPGDAFVDEAQRGRAAHQADRRQHRAARGDAALVDAGDEPLEQLGAVAQLQLQEAGAGVGLLLGAPPAHL